MANRFKSKRSESVVTQRPPEISGSKSKNALGGGGSLTRGGRNTSLVTAVAAAAGANGAVPADSALNRKFMLQHNK